MNPQLHLMLSQAIKAFEEGNFARADSILRKIIQIDSNNLLALHALGLIKVSQSKFKEAAELLTKAARINPNEASIQYNLAKALIDSGSDKASLPHHKKAVELAPTNSEAWFNYGRATFNLKLHGESLIHYSQAIRLRPDFADAWYNKAIALFELHRYEDAISDYEKVISLRPDHYKALVNKSIALNDLKRYEEALTHYDRALNLKPEYAEAWSNKGITLHDLKRYDEALLHYEQALNLNPEYAEAWSNKAVTLNNLKRYDEALLHYEQALILNPNMDWVYGHFLHLKMKICSWDDFQMNLEKLIKNVLAYKKTTPPFAFLSLTDDLLLHRHCAEVFAQIEYPFNPNVDPILNRSKGSKIKIGYFSADFNTHPVSFLTAELFELHDRQQFEIIAFSLAPSDGSPMRLRLTQSFDQFFDVSRMSDQAIVGLSRELSIDIAVDLGGYTADSRTGIFASRAAPIQVSYIGYLGTMGTRYIDYLIADKTIVPQDSEPLYAEKIVFLPSYQVNDSRRKIAEKIFTREELGLPKNGFVFCCFNNNYKILPATFQSWMNILHAVEGSVLFLYADNQWAKTNLQKEAESRNIDPKRLVFGGHLPHDEYLSRYQICDLFLDTAPYNAGTTASDALWTGLPVLTLIGKSFASRMGASLLNAINLSELITTTQTEYENKAIHLGKNPHEYAIIKQKLSENRLTTLLFNTRSFTNNLETFYKEAMDSYQADLGLENIYISP